MRSVLKFQDEMSKALTSHVEIQQSVYATAASDTILHVSKGHAQSHLGNST